MLYYNNTGFYAYLAGTFNDPPPSWRRAASIASDLAVAAAALGAAALGGRRRLDCADLGRLFVGGPLSEKTMPELRFHNLTLGYERHPAVHHLDGAVETGALIAVVGPNGAGKSTLFKGVVGVLKPLAGSIERNGRNPRDIAYLPQAPDIDRSFPINVYDMVAMGLWRRKGVFGGIDSKDRTAIEAAIAAVGLTGFEARGIGTLSGGQMQRMLFARVLVQDAGMIVLDEPFTAIDTKTSADLLSLVRRWHSEKRTVLAALHDIDLVKAAFPDTLLLAREPVAWGRTRDVLTAENLHRARHMCEAFDDSATACAVAAE
jgi:zinc/manganese transport system ATP-binding protein